MGNEASRQQWESDRFDKMLQDPQRVKPVQLTLDFLKGITSDFSEEKVLGRGGFGVVYKGILKNGRAIAVKRLKILETNLGDELYQKELKNLSGLEHKNIVQFKGYCADSSQVPWPESHSQGKDQLVLAEIRERVLCFEYVSNGSLRKHISDTSCGLEWLERFEIIKGICSGLHYLHMERRIAHMDLKPENILLDDNMTPKIADFGTSRLFVDNESRIITKNCVGSWGYMSPEYLNQGTISMKADIFSFGVIILELLTGSKFDYPQSKDLFSQFTKDVVGKWRNRLPNAGYSRQVRMCISVALNCVDANRDRRPTTEHIIMKLNEVQDPNRSWSWSWVRNTSKVAIGVGALVLMLLNPSSSWSLVVTALNLVLAAVNLFAVVYAAVALVFYLKNHCSSRQRLIFVTVGATLASVLVLLNRTSILFTIGSWAVITVKFVFTAGVTLVAIGAVVLFALGRPILAGVLLLFVLKGGAFLFVEMLKSLLSATDHPKQEDKE